MQPLITDYYWSPESFSYILSFWVNKKSYIRVVCLYGESQRVHIEYNREIQGWRKKLIRNLLQEQEKDRIIGGAVRWVRLERILSVLRFYLM